MKRIGLMSLAVVLMAAMAFANMNGSAGGMGGVDLVVAPDGTVVTVRGAGDVEAGEMMGREVVAVSPTGSILWSWSGDDPVHRIHVAGQLVLAATGTGMGDGMGYEGDELGLEGGLAALALGSGAELWNVDLPGVVTSIASTTSQIYVLVHERVESGMGMQTASRQRGAMHGPGMPPPGTNPTNPGMDPHQPGGGMGDATLVAISYDGTILWTLSLNDE